MSATMTDDDHEEHVDWRSRVLHRKNSITKQVVQQKPLQERKPEEFAAIIIAGSFLTFNAGFMNGVTLLCTGLTASHVTGIMTKSSISLSDGDIAGFASAFVILPMFIAGATVSGILIPYSSFHLGRAYNLVFLLAVVCGMQNAMTTKYSNNILRTTHMTGAATDVGIVLGRIIAGRKDEAWRLKALLPMMLAYFVGGMAGTQAAETLGPFALFINLMIFGGTGLLYAWYISNSKHITLLKAMFRKDDEEFDAIENPIVFDNSQAVENPMNHESPTPPTWQAGKKDGAVVEFGWIGSVPAASTNEVCATDLA